jgi:anaphase-promoting complex subunit 8
LFYFHLHFFAIHNVLSEPLEPKKVKNDHLFQLQSELFTLYHEKKLDSFGMYVYGTVLKELQKSQVLNIPRLSENEESKNLYIASQCGTDMVHAVLVDSLQNFPFNWSAWLDLATVCVENPALQQEVDAMLQSNAVLANHWMYHLFLVHIFLEQQENSFALQLIDGLRYRPPSPDDPERSSIGLFSNSSYLKAMEAVAYYNLRDFDTAKEHFVELYQRDPMRLDQMDIFSNILYVKESKAELSQLAHRAIRCDKYRPETCCILGNYYSSKGQHGKAVQHFQRALKLDRSCHSAWTLMGHEYIEFKNTAAAIEAYRRAVDINPRDYRAWYGLGQTYELMKMPMYSQFFFTKAAALRPYDSRMWCAIGTCCLSLDKRADAIRCFERALSNNDSEGVATQKLASLYREAGEIDRAAQCYQRHLTVKVRLVAHGEALLSDDDGLDEIHVESTEAEAILFLAWYHKERKNLTKASRLCSRLLEYPGPEKDEAKALLREIRARISTLERL